MSLINLSEDQKLLIENYLEEGNYSDATRRARTYYLKTLLGIEGFSFDKTPLELKNLIFNEMKGQKGRSFNNQHAAFKTFFEYCITNAIYLDTNPLELIKRRKVAKLVPNPFKPSQTDLILETCHPSHRFMHELLLNTGIRLDEMCHLRFQDFNSEEKILHIKSRTAGGGGKGDKGRDIPITDLLLKKYQAYLADYRLKQKNASDDFVFISRNGTRLSDRATQRRMTTLRNKLGFRIHAHRYRTTFATNLHKSGVSIYTISLLMGHEEISTTKNYILVTRDEQRQAMRQGTPLGRIEEESKEIEKLHREKADLVAEINELIKNQESLLNRVRNL